MGRSDEIQECNEDSKGCRKPGGYQRLDSGGRRSRTSEMKIGGGWRRRLWRIKLSPKLKILRGISPKRVCARIHQAYLRTVVGVARKLWFRRGGDQIDGVRGPPGKDYDERVILQLQKLLVKRKHGYAAGGITGGEIDS